MQLLFEEHAYTIEMLEQSIRSLQLTLQEFTSKSQPSTVWLIVLVIGGLACWKIWTLPTHRKEESVSKEEFERTVKQIQQLQKEVVLMQQKEVKLKDFAEEKNNKLIDDSREWKQVKKRKRK